MARRRETVSFYFSAVAVDVSSPGTMYPLLLGSIALAKSAPVCLPLLSALLLLRTAQARVSQNELNHFTPSNDNATSHPSYSSYALPAQVVPKSTQQPCAMHMIVFA